MSISFERLLDDFKVFKAGQFQHEQIMKLTNRGYEGIYIDSLCSLAANIQSDYVRKYKKIKPNRTEIKKRRKQRHGK